MGATAVAALLIKEKHIVEAFRAAGATQAEAAVAPADIGVDQRLAFGKLQRHGVLKEVAPGRFWLDAPLWEVQRTRRRRVALVIGVFVLAVALVVLALGDVILHRSR